MRQTTSQTTTAVRATGLTKHYGPDESRVIALVGVDVDLKRGGFAAITGPPGSGKSMLMRRVGLDRADEGPGWISDAQLTGLRGDALTDLRRARASVSRQTEQKEGNR
ncbi:ATP-binding cassette domain-containing protein [Streptomyces sp. WAC 06725]|uniref:ATP-binding cassette domain-containing protein n=1 Tax=Streptomyces sp. WAC 06725 TaxID=2203209 RepID=UPI000F7457D0|nr:ATP-binding cassette domain-containing protein [Streptomyces sp. WAC 06725]